MAMQELYSILWNTLSLSKPTVSHLSISSYLYAPSH